MKKAILLLFILMSPVLAANAQVLRVGAKAGGGVTNATGDDIPSRRVNTNASLHAGFLLNYDFVSAVAVQPELLFVKKGFTYDGYEVSDTESFSGDVRLNYLELPVMVQLRKGALFVEAGPYIAYLLSVGSDVNRIDRSTAGSTDPVVLGQQHYDRSNFNSFDYGYGIGAGILLTNGFLLSARHTGGFRTFSADGLTQKNQVWQISVGYVLSHRKML
ncbi:porin family protein [Botryobacter ruber]|uniref:porin family protein n=1 Tax=Botryobacter ruber TaxID=2171629 RepID=UPI000E09F5BD|nr:porin family protein [Botryobacter ruber]